MRSDFLDFDDIDKWAPRLTAALKDHVPDTIGPLLATRSPEYVEDARDILFELTNRDAIIDAVLSWVRSSVVAGYHGTRLTDAEVTSIRTIGLLPLKAEARRNRLARALSLHPRWTEMVGQLDDVIQAHGRRNKAGSREDQVHLTLSRFGLTNGFNHYLTHGAEFDQHVANALFGPEGKSLLARDGVPRIVQVGIPGDVALRAAHPFFGIEDLRANGDVPNVVCQFIDAWSFRLAHPAFQSRTLEVDCGFLFRSPVPAASILNIETLPE